ncbi:MAG TPA: hypothetical protein VM536_03770 [Chloroflexia bacterium]|nr:hypothetical protein [Chloroflexia bacterium]
MPSKTVRQNAKYREQQLRKREATQGRAAGTFVADAENDGVEMPAEATTVRFVPAGTAAAAVATQPRPVAVPRRTPGMPAASPVRTARGRIAAQMQQMNLADEMEFVRADIRRLLILAAASFAILIVLAFVIR